MKEVELPDGSKATVRESFDLTRGERKGLRRKSMIAMAGATRLIKKGFDETKPETWDVLSDVEPEDMSPFEQFEADMVMVGLVSWTRTDSNGAAVPIPATQEDWDNVRPVTIYDTLVKATEDITKVEDLSADGAVDPKAPTASSTDSLPSEEAKT